MSHFKASILLTFGHRGNKCNFFVFLPFFSLIWMPESLILVIFIVALHIELQGLLEALY